MNKVEIKGIYKHFKGDFYIVEDIALDVETERKVVIYRGLYENAPLYVRDLELFTSLVDKNKYPNIEQKYRFELQNIKKC